jgi:hypothetical protein
MKLRIPRWKDFQHYGKMRRPPWIKLHTQLLTNRHWHGLSPISAKLLVELWLVFSSEEEGGVLTGDVIDDLCWRLHRTHDEVTLALQELAVAGFVKTDDHDSVLAPREHDARSGARSGARSVEVSREEIKRVRAVRRKYSEAFEEVWKIHARGPKAKADDEYLAAVANGVTHDELIDKLTGYVAAELRPDDNPPFKGQHLFRWLKEGRWEEEFEVKRDGGYNPASIFEWFPPSPKGDSQ